MSQESLEEFIKIYESKPYLWQVKSKLNTITKRKNKKINITHKSMKTIQTRQKGNERIDTSCLDIFVYSVIQKT
jgi:spore coat protein CotH